MSKLVAIIAALVAILVFAAPSFGYLHVANATWECRERQANYSSMTDPLGDGALYNSYTDGYANAGSVKFQRYSDTDVLTRIYKRTIHNYWIWSNCRVQGNDYGYRAWPSFFFGWDSPNQWLASPNAAYYNSVW